MSKPFRLIDTGIRDGRQNIALGQALVDLHKDGQIGDTLRFLRFPPTALIGRHQDLGKELKLEFCAANNIRTVRRITGGGALYFDEGQLGWELLFDRKTLGVEDLGGLAKAICEAAAHGLSKLGVDARYRAPNDIEIGGRKVSGTGGFFDGTTLFYQGTVLIDMDPATMVQALNLPAPPPVPEGETPPPPRIITLKEALGETPEIDAVKAALVDGFSEKLGLSFTDEDLSPAEEERATQYHDEEIGTDAFVAEINDPESDASVHSGTLQTAGGKISAHVRLEGPGDGRIREVLIAGDFFAAPARVVLDYEAALRGTSTALVETTTAAFFNQAEVSFMTVKPADFADAVMLAIGEHSP